MLLGLFSLMALGAADRLGDKLVKSSWSVGDWSSAVVSLLVFGAWVIRLGMVVKLRRANG
jgi:hypothetical protein